MGSRPVEGKSRRHHPRHVLRVRRRPGPAAVDVGRDEVDLLAVLVRDGGAGGGPGVGAQDDAVLELREEMEGLREGGARAARSLCFPGSIAQRAREGARVLCTVAGVSSVTRSMHRAHREAEVTPSRDTPGGRASFRTAFNARERRSRPAPRALSPLSHTLNTSPTMVVPVFLKPGAFTPRASKAALRASRSNANPPPVMTEMEREKEAQREREGCELVRRGVLTARACVCLVSARAARLARRETGRRSRREK